MECSGGVGECSGGVVEFSFSVVDRYSDEMVKTYVLFLEVCL